MSSAVTAPPSDLGPAVKRVTLDKTTVFNICELSKASALLSLLVMHILIQILAYIIECS